MHAGRALPSRTFSQPTVLSMNLPRPMSGVPRELVDPQAFLRRPVRDKNCIAGVIQAADVWGI